MVILFLKRTPPSLRGELSRWMIEPQAGVFVGNISAIVRDKLWDSVLEEAPEASAMLLYGAQTEQGFALAVRRRRHRRPRDFEGLDAYRALAEHVPDALNRWNRSRSGCKSKCRSPRAWGWTGIAGYRVPDHQESPRAWGWTGREGVWENGPM